MDGKEGTASAGKSQHIVNQTAHAFPLQPDGFGKTFSVFHRGMGHGGQRGNDHSQGGTQFMGGGGDKFRLLLVVDNQWLNHVPGKEPEKQSQQQNPGQVCAQKENPAEPEGLI